LPDHDAETTYDGYVAAWEDWQFGCGTSAGPEELEAGRAPLKSTFPEA